jgi:hypothetical protein
MKVSHIVGKKILLTRLVPGIVVVAVTVGSALLVSNGLASAAPSPGTLGFITLDKPEGTNLTAINSTTSGPCPETSNRADLQVVGPIGVPANQQVFPPSNPFTAVAPIDTQFSTTDPFKQFWRVTFQDAVVERGLTAVPTGEYDYTTSCLPRFGSNNFGTFTGGLTFDTPTHYSAFPNGTPTPTPTPVMPTPTPTPVMPTPTPTPVTPTPTPTPVTPTPTPTPVTPTPVPGATATATKLNVLRIGLPFGLGGFIIPLTNVAPNAAGTIQLKDGFTNVGGPVPVAGGFAFGGFFVLPAGSHSLTAEFTPADPATFTPSTSNTVRFRFRGIV